MRKEYSLERMVRLATAMSAEKDTERLSEMILTEAEDVVPFITALASLAGVCLNNRRMAQNIQDMLHSFVQVRKTDHAGRDHG